MDWLAGVDVCIDGWLGDEIAGMGSDGEAGLREDHGPRGEGREVVVAAVMTNTCSCTCFSLILQACHRPSNVATFEPVVQQPLPNTQCDSCTKFLLTWTSFAVLQVEADNLLITRTAYP